MSVFKISKMIEVLSPHELPTEDFTEVHALEDKTKSRFRGHPKEGYVCSINLTIAAVGPRTCLLYSLGQLTQRHI